LTHVAMTVYTVIRENYLDELVRDVLCRGG
jgi:hypothetical protein